MPTTKTKLTEKLLTIIREKIDKLYKRPCVVELLPDQLRLIFPDIDIAKNGHTKCF